MGENEYGESGHLSTFILLKHLMMLLKYNFLSGLHFYTLPKTLIACRAMQLRFCKVKTLLNNALKISWHSKSHCQESQIFIKNVQEVSVWFSRQPVLSGTDSSFKTKPKEIKTLTFNTACKFLWVSENKNFHIYHCMKLPLITNHYTI